MCRRIERRRRRSELVQFLARVAGVEPIADVAFRCEPWQLENPYDNAEPGERRPSATRVPASGVIVVRANDDFLDARSLDLVCIVIAPAGGTACSCRSRNAKRAETISILLALSEEDASLLGELVEPIDDPADVPEAPDPAPAAVGPARAEVLGLESHNLVEQVSALVPVVVRCNFAAGRETVARACQVFEAHVDGSGDLLDAAICAVADRRICSAWCTSNAVAAPLCCRSVVSRSPFSPRSRVLRAIFTSSIPLS